MSTIGLGFLVVVAVLVVAFMMYKYKTNSDRGTQIRQERENRLKQAYNQLNEELQQHWEVVEVGGRVTYRHIRSGNYYSIGVPNAFITKRYDTIN